MNSDWSIPYGAKESIKNPKSLKGFLDEIRDTKHIAVGDILNSCGVLDL